MPLSERAKQTIRVALANRTSAEELIEQLDGVAIGQRAGGAQASIATTAPTNSSPYGYATSAQAAAIVTMLNEVRATLVEMGVWKGSA